MFDLRSASLPEIEELMESLGEKKFRAAQVFEWLNNKLVTSFDEMTNLSKPLRSLLSAHAYISGVKIKEKFQSAEDKTIKYLFEMENDTIIEGVLMKYSHGNSVCVSTQAGCRMGCRFCASTLDGVERNLTAGEIAAQVYEVQKDIGERVSHIVLMGSGEPFDNFDNVMRFIDIINSDKGLGIGQRHITVSTCGLIDRILEFSAMKMQVNLAVSLHAPNDEIRKKLMPIAARNSFDELLAACRRYSDETGRRVTYEYAMIKGVNDGIEAARELGLKLRNSLSHVNIIPLNNVIERSYTKSDSRTVAEFAEVLQRMNVTVTIRRRLGSDVDAACGQLRRGYVQR